MVKDPVALGTGEETWVSGLSGQPQSGAHTVGAPVECQELREVAHGYRLTSASEQPKRVGVLSSYIWGYTQRGQHSKGLTRRPSGRVRIQTQALSCALIPRA